MTTTNENNMHPLVVFERPTTPIAHIVIDLETLGTAADAAILAIGAAGINIGNQLDGRFYTPVGFTSNMLADRTVDTYTVDWWFRQPEEPKKYLDLVSGPYLVKALEDLNTFVRLCSFNLFKLDEKRHPNIWGNGSEFDLTILNNAFRRLKRKAEWQYWQQQSLRTVTWFNYEFGLGVRQFRNDDPRNAHYALADAEREAMFLAGVIDTMERINAHG